uniref:Uncharacterized protein n=1 Tax=Anguilla anguilla TaxID=7936 RepID=A0A0E9TVJ6_ANGAN
MRRVIFYFFLVVQFSPYCDSCI